MLEKIRLQNYRCFEDSTIQIKDLTIIVGKNNAGKSTVVEALRMIAHAGIKSRNAVYKEPDKVFELPSNYRGFSINVGKLKIDLRAIVHYYRPVTAIVTAYFIDKSKIVIYLQNDTVFACLFDDAGEIVNTKKKALQSGFDTLNILPQIGLIKENEKLLTEDTILEDKDTYLSSRHFRNELLLHKDEECY